MVGRSFWCWSGSGLISAEPYVEHKSQNLTRIPFSSELVLKCYDSLFDLQLRESVRKEFCQKDFISTALKKSNPKLILDVYAVLESLFSPKQKSINKRHLGKL